jgi:hypothetical protein
MSADEAPEDVLALGLLEVEDDRPLVPVQAHERRALTIQEGGREPHLIASGRRLDLDHLGAQVRQLHAAEGARHVVADLEHSNPCERWVRHTLLNRGVVSLQLLPQ